MSKNTTIITIITVLIIGLSIGYLLGTNTITSSTIRLRSNNEHIMSNGSMMDGNESMNMQDSMNSMHAGLKGKTGDAFDQVFLRDMIIHHQGAVEMAQSALINAKHQEIKTLANEIIIAQIKEIAEMKSWQKNWYNQ